MYKIPAASSRPVTFLNTAYIRVGSLTKKLLGYPEKEAKLWRREPGNSLNKTVVKECKTAGDVVKYLSAETYFDKLHLPLPQTTDGIVERLLSEKLICKTELGYGITELGAILLAKDLRDFDNLHRKAVRIIVYKGKNKIETIREQSFEQGYAVCFSQMVDWVNGQLPANEEIGQAERIEVRMYPPIAIREIMANMLIHQDFSVLGFPMIEIYSDRVEISSPGQPLISTDRFIDEYQSRNEDLADIMRRMGFCEEKGSGMDKALSAIEKYKLPAIKYRVSEIRTSIILTEYKTWAQTTKEERLQVKDSNYPAISQLIKEAIRVGLIKVGTPEGTNRRDIGYIPIWG